MDSELWLKKIFLKYACADRPLLLILDGHKSPVTPDVIDEARKNEIEILCFPPHTTHVLQPLDKVVFGPLKEKYFSAVTNRQ